MRRPYHDNAFADTAYGLIKADSSTPSAMSRREDGLLLLLSGPNQAPETMLEALWGASAQAQR